MKYVLYIDYCAGSKKQFEYMDLPAKTIEEAIEKAEETIWAHERKNGEVYLARILKRTGTMPCVHEFEKKYETFAGVMCKRTVWHRNTAENGERDHRIIRVTYKRDKNIDFVTLA